MMFITGDEDKALKKPVCAPTARPRAVIGRGLYVEGNEPLATAKFSYTILPGR